MCLSQFGNKKRRLGSYELQEDAARAFDKVARTLGRSRLNFPNSDALEITGPRSEGADEAVAVAVEAAKAFVAAGGNNQTSIYTGVNKEKRTNTNPWRSTIRVSSEQSSKNMGCIVSALMAALMHAH